MNINAFKSDKADEEKYICLVVIFNMAQQMAGNKVDGWVIDSSFTDCDNREYITTYTNGKMIIKAHSVDGDHNYSLDLINNG